MNDSPKKKRFVENLDPSKHSIQKSRCVKTSFRSSTEFSSTSLLISAAQGHNDVTNDVTKVLLDNGASYGEKDKAGFQTIFGRARSRNGTVLIQGRAVLRRPDDKFEKHKAGIF